MPWELSFSYGRALQQPPLEIWSKGPEHLQEAQQAFLHRAHMNSLAREGKYRKELEAGGS
jgi:fructose-bisphosphate aldolase class I